MYVDAALHEYGKLGVFWPQAIVYTDDVFGAQR